MNTADLETMRETMRTMAEAIAELSKMCEGLPKFLENKIGQFRAEMTTSISSVIEQLRADAGGTASTFTILLSQQAELEGKLKVFQESINSTIDTATAETRQIIAGNRAETAADLLKLNELMLERDAEVRAVCNSMSIEQLNTGLGEVRKEVDEVVIAVNTSNKAGAIVRNDIQSLKDSVSMINDVWSSEPEKVAAAIAESTAKQCEITDAIRANIRALTDRTDELVVQHETAVVQQRVGITALEEQIAVVKTGLTTVTENAAKQADTTGKVCDAMRADINALAGRADVLAGRADAMAGHADALQGQIVNAEVGLTAMLQSAEERANVALVEKATVIGTELRAVEEVVVRHTEEINGGAIFLKGIIETTLPAHKKEIGELQNAVLEIPVQTNIRIEQEVGAAMNQIVGHDIRFRKVEEEINATATMLKGVTDTVLPSHKAALDSLENTVAEIPAQIQIRIEQAIEPITEIATVRYTDIMEQIGAHTAGATAHSEAINGLASETQRIDLAVQTIAGDVANLNDSFNTREVILSGRVSDIEEKLPGLAELTSEVPKLMQFESDHYLDTAKQFKEVNDCLVSAQNQAHETSVKLGEVKAEIDQTIDSRFAVVTEHIGNVQTTLEAKLQGSEQQWNEALGKLAENRHMDLVGHAQTHERFTQTAIAKAVEGLARQEDVDKVLTDIIEQNTASWTGALAAIDEVKQDAIELAKQFGGDMASSHAAIAALVEQVKAVQPGVTPEQLAELQVKLMAQPPDAEFTLAYEDAMLVVSLKYGDKDTSTTIPVNIGVEYVGVYKRESLPGYVAGRVVSHKGSMWISRGSPTGEPGKDFTGWQLIVKCGRDGKEARPIRTYAKHSQKNVYYESDFLRLNNRLWQCVVEETKTVPEPGDIASTHEWILIGGVH